MDRETSKRSDWDNWVEFNWFEFWVLFEILERDCLRLEMEVWDCGSCCSISTLLLRRFKIERRKRVTERRKNERSKESKESVGNGGFFEEVEQNGGHENEEQLSEEAAIDNLYYSRLWRRYQLQENLLSVILSVRKIN